MICEMVLFFLLFIACVLLALNVLESTKSDKAKRIWIFIVLAIFIVGSVIIVKRKFEYYNSIEQSDKTVVVHE